MLDTWDQRVRRDGIVRQADLVSRCRRRQLADLRARFEAAVTPRTKVIHVCHITNLTGQIFPIRDICRMARARGITTIVDGAHAFGHFPFTLADLECDYYGTSLHKWLLAPVGTGFLYVRRPLIKGHWALTPASRVADADIRKFEEIGTHPAANHCDRRGARLPPDHWRRAQGGAAALPAPGWATGCASSRASQAVDELRPGAVGARSARSASRASTPPSCRPPLGQATHHRHADQACGVRGPPGYAQPLHDPRRGRQFHRRDR